MNNPLGSDDKGGFRGAERLFAPALTVCDRSPSFGGIRRQVSGLLALADRHALACAATPGMIQATTVAETLAGVPRKTECQSDERLEQEIAKSLLPELEPWLKSVLAFAQPQSYAEGESKGRYFNLFEVMRRLGLLTAEELERPVEDWQALPDRARGYLLLFKEHRNVKFHGGGLIDLEGQRAVPTSLLLTILAALYAQRDNLRRALRGLVTRPIELREHESAIVETMRAERERHLKYFAGRAEVLGQLSALTSADGPPRWIAVVGPAGMGKSALSAAFTRAHVEALPAIGPGADAARRTAPWLPGGALQLGSQCKSIVDAASLIVAQMSALLLEPLPRLQLTDGHSALEGDWQADVVLRMEPGHGRGESEPGGIEGYKAIAQVRGRAASTADRCRASLYSALRRVADERGDALLIVDALDEMPDFGEGHAWLPRELPPGCQGLVFSRDTPALARFLEERPGSARLELGRLTRAEIEKVLGVDPSAWGDFLDKVEVETGGWPTEVAPLRLQLEQLADPARVQIRRHRELLNYMASAWEGPILDALLDVFAAFEPCGPLSLEALQGWLRHRGHRVRRGGVQAAIARIADQLNGRECDRLRLALGPFADHLRDEHFSPLDWRELLVDVFAWAQQDASVDIEAATTFLAVWRRGEGRTRSLVSNLPGLSAALEDRLEPGRGGTILWKSNPSGDSDFSSAGLEFARRCWNLGCTDAGGSLAARLAVGLATKCDVPEAIRVWEQVVELDADEAVRFANYLFLPAPWGGNDPNRGLRVLRKAATMSTRATIQLAERLIDGEGIEADAREGLRLLRQAGDVSAKARAVLGCRLLNGEGVERSPTEGMSLLRAAAEEDAEWWIVLARRLQDGQGDSRIPEDIARMLPLAAEATPWAKSLFADRLLDGDGIPEDRTLGLRLLEEAANADPDVAVRLARRLLRGRGVPRDVVRGLELFRSAAREHPLHAFELGNRLVDGTDIPIDAAEGLEHLRALVKPLPSDNYRTVCLSGSAVGG